VFDAEKSKLNSYEQELYNKACNGDTLAQKELFKRMLAKTPSNLRRFIIDVNKYPVLTPGEAQKKLQQIYTRKTQ
jgi:hypothetical protein